MIPKTQPEEKQSGIGEGNYCNDCNDRNDCTDCNDCKDYKDYKDSSDGRDSAFIVSAFYLVLHGVGFGNGASPEFHRYRP